MEQGMILEVPIKTGFTLHTLFH